MITLFRNQTILLTFLLFAPCLNAMAPNCDISLVPACTVYTDPALRGTVIENIPSAYNKIRSVPDLNFQNTFHQMPHESAVRQQTQQAITPSPVNSVRQECFTFVRQGDIAGLKKYQEQLQHTLKGAWFGQKTILQEQIAFIETLLKSPIAQALDVIRNGSLIEADKMLTSLEREYEYCDSWNHEPTTARLLAEKRDSCGFNCVEAARAIFEKRTDRHLLSELKAQQHAQREMLALAPYATQECIIQTLTENTELLSIYSEYNFGDQSHVISRIEAIKEIESGTITITRQEYILSSSANSLLDAHGFDAALYAECHGNQLQQKIHQECINIIEELALPNHDVLVKAYCNSVLQFVDAAREHNQANSPIEAMSIADVCWSILDCCKAAGEGVIEGTIGTIINHPIETALCICAPEFLLAYNLGKIAYAYVDIKIASLESEEAGGQKLAEYIKPLTDCIDAISAGDITLRGSIKVASAVATQVVLQGKVNAGLKSFYETTKERAVNYLSNNPTAAIGQYAVTPDGRLLRAAGRPGENTLFFKKMNGKGLNNTPANNVNYSAKTGANNPSKNPEWAVYKSKHKAPNGVPWEKVVKSTRHGEARYKPEVNIRKLEMHAWENGQFVTKEGKNWKVFKYDEIIGAKWGKETQYIRVECSANTIHGHPISAEEYARYTK